MMKRFTSTLLLLFIGTLCHAQQTYYVSTIRQDAGVELTSDTSKKEFRIYPNPASHTLTVDGVAAPKAFSAELLNVLGVTLAARQSSAGNPVQFDLSAYAPGVYFVRLRAPEEETIRRIIKR